MKRFCLLRSRKFGLHMLCSIYCASANIFGDPGWNLLTYRGWCASVQFPFCELNGWDGPLCSQRPCTSSGSKARRNFSLCATRQIRFFFFFSVSQRIGQAWTMERRLQPNAPAECLSCMDSQARARVSDPESALLQNDERNTTGLIPNNGGGRALQRSSIPARAKTASGIHHQTFFQRSLCRARSQAQNEISSLH